MDRDEIHGLVGENGAGKSTLGRILAGVHAPETGECYVDGERVSFRSPKDALEAGITMVSQEPALVPERTVAENVFLGVEPKRGAVVRRRVLRSEYRKLATRVGFDLDPGQRVSALRLADRQKVEIMRAVARDARLIVFDEPTAPLAAGDKEKLFEIVRWLKSEHVSVVYVSHFLDEVLALVDNVTILKDGRLVRTAPAAEETSERLIEGMLGRSLDLVFPPKTYPEPDASVVFAATGVSRGSVLHDVSLELRAGEIVGLTGLVGSGRSELARVLFGADRADSGELTLEGRRVRFRSPSRAVRAGVAMIPESRQTQGLVMDRSLLENVTLPHLREVVAGGVIRPARARKRGDVALGSAGVAPRRLRAPARSLSGGNQQKLLFAKWLFRKPRFLVADEPTRGVDVGAKTALYNLLHSLAQEGIAILFISSESEEVLGLAHRILVMNRGRIVAELDGETATERDIMQAAFASPEHDGNA